MNRRAALVGLFAGVLSVAAVVPQAHAQQAGGASHIAVVNLKQVYATMQETVDTQNQLKGLQGELETMTKSHQAQLSEMQQKMTNSVKPSSDEHIKMMQDFDEKSLEFQLDEQKMKVRMVREQSKELTQAFSEISGVVSDLAKKRGIDLVLVSNSPDLPNTAADIGNPEQLLNLVFNRSVLYAGDKIDITADVVTALDANYKSKSSGK